jgi:hypothetical protein
LIEEMGMNEKRKEESTTNFKKMDEKRKEESTTDFKKNGRYIFFYCSQRFIFFFSYKNCHV